MPLAHCVLAALALQLGDPPEIMVVPSRFEGELEAHWRGVIQEQLRAGLSEGDVRLHVPDDSDPVVSSCRESDCAVAIARQAGSRYVVRSRVRVVEKDFMIDLDVVDATNGELLATVRDTCELCGAKEGAEMARSLAASLRSKVDALHKAQPGLAISSDPPGAQVKIDGRPVGVTPLQLELDVGEHRIEIEKKGYVSQSRSVTTVSGVWDRVTIDLVTQRSDWRPAARAVGWAGLGAGFASLTAGATLLALDGRPYRTDCQGDAEGDCRHLYDTKAGGIVGLVIGSVLAVTGTTLVASASKRGKKRSTDRVQLGAAPPGLIARF